MTYYEKTLQRIALLKNAAKKTKGTMKKVWKQKLKEVRKLLEEMTIEQAEKVV
mgnify:CR=1 FL=1